MDDTVRNTTMSRSSYMCSTRKDNAEEVARRRAAMQQEIEQRQKLARKLQDEKMARAIAQKEEHLMKQRKAQQREMLRAKAVLDRRTQVLANKEKEKKEAVLAKVHAVASRLTAQHKSRPLYAFGSSTPRELEYLTHLTREQKVYDRKLMPSDRSSTAASGSSSHMTLTPPYDSRNLTSRASMTGSLYVAQSELKTRHKPTLNYMTQSMMITPKPVKIKNVNHIPVHHPMMTQRSTITTKATPFAMAEVQSGPKKFVQKYMPVCRQRSGMVQSKPFETIGNALKSEPMSKKMHKPAGAKINSETKGETMVEKLSSDQMNEILVVLERNDEEDDLRVHDIATTEARNTIGLKEIVDLVHDTNGIKKFDKGDLVLKDSEEEKLENAGDTYKNGNEIQNNNRNVRGVIMLESASDAVIVEDPPQLSLKSGGEDSFLDETRANSGTITLVNAAFDEEGGIHAKQEMKNDLMESESQYIMDGEKISKIDRCNHGLMHPDLLKVKVFGEGQEDLESVMKIVVEEEPVVMNKELFGNGRFEEVIIKGPYETAQNKEENIVSATEANDNFIGEKKAGSPGQRYSVLIEDGLEAISEGSKLAEESNSLKEKRRIQDELLEKEQREREIRKAKLASIMSRTRGGAPPMAVIPPPTNVESAAIIAQEDMKHISSIPLANEYMPMKNTLSHTAASVLQKLATTNPKLLSVLQRNGSNQSLADELSAADPSMSVTLPGQPIGSITSHEGSAKMRHLPFEPDINHRPVAMK
uniref:Uncharacterized protein n=1 Tax=Setaria digitata TaxID=48799 RepID=A0A915PYN2_9BILA